MGYVPNAFTNIVMSECNQIMPGQRFSNTINFIPSFNRCCNPILFGIPNICLGNSTGIAHGYGIPNYNNGSFMSYLDMMAIAHPNQLLLNNLSMMTLPHSNPLICNNRRININPYNRFMQNENPITTLGKLAVLHSILNATKKEINSDFNKNNEIKIVYDDNDADETPSKSNKDKNADLENKPKYTKVELTDELRSRRNDIIYSVKNTWYGTRDQLSECRAISKMEELSDDEFIAMFSDKDYAEEMSIHLCKGSNADGVMEYITRRLYSFAPKNYKIYADNGWWADSFYVLKEGIKPSYAHELEFDGMNGFKNGVDIYEGDFTKVVIDLGDLIQKNRYN